MAAGVIWAHFAELDEVKRGNGRVVPSRQIQVLQSLEGGIVREILVHEGTIVKEGEVLMKIDDTRFASELVKSGPVALQMLRVSHASKPKCRAVPRIRR